MTGNLPVIVTKVMHAGGGNHLFQKNIRLRLMILRGQGQRR
jgi:hypothetical protein